MTTSRNICQTGEFPTSDFYTIVCDCSHEDHNMSMVIEVEDGTVQLIFYKKLWAKALWCPITWSEKIRDWHGRFKIIWDVLFKGYAEYEADFLIQSPQAIDDLITAISESKTKMMLQQAEERKKYCTTSAE